MGFFNKFMLQLFIHYKESLAGLQLLDPSAYWAWLRVTCLMSHCHPGVRGYPQQCWEEGRFQHLKKTTRYGVERLCLTIYFVISLFLLTSLPWLPHCFSMTSIFRYFAGKVWENYFAFIFLINISFSGGWTGEWDSGEAGESCFVFKLFQSRFLFPRQFPGWILFQPQLPLIQTGWIADLTKYFVSELKSSFRRGPSSVSSPMDLKKNRWLLPRPDLLL